MPLGVAAGVVALAVGGGLEIDDDLAAGIAGPHVMRVDVLDDVVAALRLGAADVVGLRHVAVDLEALHGREHDDGVAEGQLGIADMAVAVGDDRAALKSERRASQTMAAPTSR